jgi:hypothetical protein
MFNTVRRMTDTTLTLFPQAQGDLTALGYSQNIFQGPSLSPGASSNFFDEVDRRQRSALLQEYQRNSTDDFTAGVDWKPLRGTHAEL